MKKHRPDPAAMGEAAAHVGRARRIVALTGAGISTESGIPDFRSPGGLWSRFDPEQFSYPRYLASAGARQAFWRWAIELFPPVSRAQPNAGHRALAALEREGRLRAVVTQNIDGLHQRAGSREVIELHGSATRVGCLRCGRDYDHGEVAARLVADDYDPHCAGCGGILKPRVVLFGEEMPAAETARAYREAAAADLLLVVGTSLEVYPAAGLVPAARGAGAAVVIVNLERTALDGEADVVVRGQAGEVLPLIAERSI